MHQYAVCVLAIKYQEKKKQVFFTDTIFTPAKIVGIDGSRITIVEGFKWKLSLNFVSHLDAQIKH